MKTKHWLLLATAILLIAFAVASLSTNKVFPTDGQIAVGQYGADRFNERLKEAS